VGAGLGVGTGERSRPCDMMATVLGWKTYRCANYSLRITKRVDESTYLPLYLILDVVLGTQI